MAHRFFTKILILCFAVVLGGFIGAQPVGAETGSEACDSDFNDVMHARAQLEAMREMEVAQALILKPDSVLEYSCFDDRLNRLAAESNTLFSGNIFSRVTFNIPPQQWDGDDLIRIMPDEITAPNTGQEVLLAGPNPPGPSLSGRAFRTLGDFVYIPMFTLLVENYSHVYGGGTFSDIPSPVAPGETAPCNPMELVWKFLKCQNINKDLFLTFDELIDDDPRLMVVNPDELPACLSVDRSAILTAARDLSNNIAGQPGGAEPVITYLSMMDSSACSSQQPIATGVMVYPSGSSNQPFNDAVCLAAGCVYDGEGGCQ